MKILKYLFILLPFFGFGQSADGTFKTVTASGTNSYTISEVLKSPDAYDIKEKWIVTFTNGNTGASTINRNNLGAKGLKKLDGSDFNSGDIPAGGRLLITYNGTYYQGIGIAGVPTSRNINTTAPLTGGGSLSGDLTLNISTFGSSTSGIVPSSGGGTINFLRADGTWTAPPSGGSNPFSDASALVKNSSDATKLAIFNIGAITTGTTRTYKFPNTNSTFYPSDRVYNVEDYGAKHNFQSVTDGQITSGTAILTSAAANFTVGDVGKYVWISGAGAAGVGLQSTILSFQSSTQVTINTNASTTVTTGTINWATDDTAAIQSAITSVFNAGGGIIYFPIGIYICSGALQTSVSGTNPNAQLYVPSLADNSAVFPTIKFLGESHYTWPNLFNQSITTGVILRSTLATGTGTNPCLLGTIGTTGNFQNFNYTDLVFENITFQVYTNAGAIAPQISAFNGQYMSSISAKKCSFVIDVALANSTNPSSSETFGAIFGNVNNNGPNIIEECTWGGFKYGAIIGEHHEILNSYSVGNYNGYVFLNGSWPVIGHMYAGNCKNMILIPNGTICNITQTAAAVSPFNIILEAEEQGSGKWYNVDTFISDVGNNGKGTVRYAVGSATAITPVFTSSSKIDFSPLTQSVPRQFSTNGGPITWGTTSNSWDNRAVFEIHSGTSGGAEVNSSRLSFVTGQTNTSLGSVFNIQAVNTAISASEKRIFGITGAINGAVNTSQIYFFSMTGGTYAARFIYDDTQFALQSGVNLKVASKAYFGSTSTTPTALIHLNAGTASANTAPLKFTAPAALLTTPEALTIEPAINGDYLNFTTTTGTKRRVIVAGTSGRATAQTAANSSVATYTLGATDASYEVSANILVTTSSAENFTVTVDYTDEGNTARTATFNFQILAGTISTSIASANGAVPYEGLPLHIRCKASTTITIKTTGTFTGATYNVEGIIKQTQ